MPAELLVIAVAVGAALAFWRLDQDTARSVFQTAKTFRRVIFGAVALLTAFVLIGSGFLPYQLIGAAIIAYGTLLVLVEEPHERVREVVG